MPNRKAEKRQHDLKQLFRRPDSSLEGWAKKLLGLGVESRRRTPPSQIMGKGDPTLRLRKRVKVAVVSNDRQVRVRGRQRGRKLVGGQ